MADKGRLIPALPYMGALLICALTLVALLEFNALLDQRRAETDRSYAVSHLGAIRGRLESALVGPLLLTRGMQADIIEHKGMSETEFSDLAALLLTDFPAIRNMTLSQGTVVSAVYPLAGNERVIGLDYRSRPEQWASVERAIQSRGPVLAGPVNLVQGGKALIGRLPLFIPGEASGKALIGLVSVVIDLPRVFSHAGIDEATLPIRLAIRGRDGMGAEGGMIWGEESLFSSPNAVQMDVDLPGGRWRIAGQAPSSLGRDAELLARTTGGGVALLVMLLSFVGAVHVRAQARARAASVESEKQYRGLVEMAPIAVCVHRHGRVLLVNGACAALFGADSAEAMIGLDVLDRVHPDHRATAEERIARLEREGGQAPPVRFTMLSLDGRSITAEVASSRVQSGGGNAVLTMLQDVSMREAAEAERERLMLNLRRSNDDLLQFAHIASHDLQEPLRSITGYVQLLKRRYHDKLDAEADQYIDFAVDGTKRLQRMLNDLLDYSRLGDGMDTVSTAHCATQDMVRQLMDDMAAEINASGARIDLASAFPSVAVPGHEVSRIFRILLGNAIKYRKPGQSPRIVVSVLPEAGGNWRFSVADDGIGIAPEYHERIFSAFHRLHPRGAYEGSGIGLAICRKLIHSHGGRIWVESEAGQGATFYFILPQARQSSPDS